MARQKTLVFGPLKNVGLFSSHWIEHRLRLEPEWKECERQAREALHQLGQLWTKQRVRVAKYGDEAGLEEGFIQPVLQTLGWELKYQTFLQGRKPDYALFLDDAALDRALKVDRTSDAFWKHPVVVADAKAWHVSLDRPLRIDGKREFPPEQIEWYLDKSRLDYGILTNGKLWRLIPRVYGPQQRRFQTYLECDLPAILDAGLTKAILIDDFLEFFLFFSPVAFAERDGRRPLIARAVEGSSEYRVGIGESLKRQAFRSLEFCIAGFLNYGPNALNPRDHMSVCREQSLVLLYRLLFVMFAEDRRLLPCGVNPTYTKNRSLRRYRDEIGGRLDRLNDQADIDYSRDTADIWGDLDALFDLVDRGHRSYGVPAYNGGLFDPDDHTFLSTKKVPDYYLARAIDQLSRAPDPEHLPRGLFRVDYRDLAIQHLGSIYEGLLELRPRHASERMVVARRHSKGRTEEKVVPTAAVPDEFLPTETVYPRGAIYLETDKGERRATGSYYTPDHIVDCIVGKTLGPLCERVHDELTAEIQEAERKGDLSRAAELKSSFDDRILRLRILDPAMGSAHFLIRACQFLAEEIATHPYTSDDALIHAADEESAITFWKRRVAENCLFGVDLNGMAVELAKLALWLETVAIDRPLTFLDHHLRPGNSLIGAKLAELGATPGEIAIRVNAVAQQVEAQVPILLKPLDEIRRMPSETVEQIKGKQRLYKLFEKLREPFLLVADLWASTFGAAEFTDRDYQLAIDAMTTLKKFAQLIQETKYADAITRVKRPDFLPFHWELEFLEAFYKEGARRDDAGFDAIMGNPPYDVLSELESGRDLSVLRSFIDHEPMYGASKRGKNNLYKLFICRALDLLAAGGYFGFIVPMPLLGDDQAAGIRRQIIDVGSFTGIEAFPQKDNPANRVFPEAKLSTTVFTLLKGEWSGSFQSRVHPGRLIEDESPSLKLTTAEIGQYDPENLTIVSCDQADWDLAVRIMRSGRMVRLGTVAESFQGEVNESNDRESKRISYHEDDGPEVIRGAHLCLYALREASQGKAVFLVKDRFLDRTGSGEQKAFHHRFERIGFQRRKSPQNNFRRLIAARVPVGTFLLESVSYFPQHKSGVPLSLILAVLNSKLCDWYFRLGSTNAMVGEYQVNILPFPSFSDGPHDGDSSIAEAVLGQMTRRDFVRAFELMRPLLDESPFSPAIQTVMSEAVTAVERIEADRGHISRTERSALADDAQPFQDFIDRLFYAMAGLTDDEANGLESRLAKMK